MNTSWRPTEEKVEQINKMNAVGKCNSRVRPGTLEAAKYRPQHLEPAESPISNRVAHPQRCRIEPENMPHLQNQSGFLRELRQLFRLTRSQSDWFFDKNIFPHFE